MMIASLFLGLFFIICGIAIKNKKWLWIHQGLMKRPVEVDKYTYYMGIIDIITGIIFIMVGFMFYYFKISSKVMFIIFILYCAFSIYGEVKYRKKQV